MKLDIFEFENCNFHKLFIKNLLFIEDSDVFRTCEHRTEKHLKPHRIFSFFFHIYTKKHNRIPLQDYNIRFVLVVRRRCVEKAFALQ